MGLVVSGTGAFSANVRTVSTTATVSSVDDTILCDGTGGSFIVTLPAANAAPNKVYVISKIDSSANLINVSGTGFTTTNLAGQYESITVQSNGTTWYIISNTIGLAGSAGNIKATTSGTKTPTGSGNYHQMTSNSVVLTQGTWLLFGSGAFNQSGGSAAYSDMILGWFGANGADSASTPTQLSSTANLTLNSAQSSPLMTEMPFTVSATITLAPVVVTVTASVTVYLVPYSQQSTSANARITVYANAIRQ